MDPREILVPCDLLMGALSDVESPVTFANIKTWTGKDPSLSHVRHIIIHGWQEDSSFGLVLLFRRKPRSHLDILFPDVGIRVRKKQEHQN